MYVDGSKRDRTVWPGDLAIAVPSILVSTGDWDGLRNTLAVLWNDQVSYNSFALQLWRFGEGVQRSNAHVKSDQRR